MNPLHLTEVLCFAVISYLDFPSWVAFYIVAVTTRLPFWKEAFARGLRHLIARDISRLLIGRRLKLLLVIRNIGRLYKEQFGSSIKQECDSSIEQVINENQYLFIFSTDRQSISPAFYLNQPLLWTSNARQLLISYGLKRTIEGVKKSIKIRTKKEKKRTRNRENKFLLPSANKKPSEEKAKVLLLKKFGCSPELYFYHTQLHPDLTSYRHAWMVVSEKMDFLLVHILYSQFVRWNMIKFSSICFPLIILRKIYLMY